MKPGPDPPLQVEDTEENATNNSKSKTRYYSKKGNATRNRTINDEHNEVCEVCDRGGDLMCCDTCTLVFHMPCIRPKISSMPKGSWSCPYCIVDVCIMSTIIFHITSFSCCSDHHNNMIIFFM